jgi:hypothetical protein
MKPIIHLNQAGASLVNRLLDFALKGGGLDALNTVNEVIVATQNPASPGVPPKEEPREKDISKENKEPK